MTSHDAWRVTIPFITGDGIGVDITPVTRQVVDATVRACYGDSRRIEWLEVLAGQRAYDQTGSLLPEATVAILRQYPVAIKGPLATPVGGGFRSVNVALRVLLDLYACVRPVRWFEGVRSPLRHPERVDMVVFRENTEDVYAGIEWAAGSAEAQRFYEFLRDEMGVTGVRFPNDCAFGVKPMSRQGSERLVRAALAYARRNGRESVTLVHKGNIQKFTEGGFRQWGYDVAAREFPDIAVRDVIADAFLQNTLLRPRDYSVIAAPNLNGDYISDQLAAMVGGIGIAPGANINYETGHAIFEATHGVAPDLVGTGRANPSSLLLSAAMMLAHLGWTEAADALTRALADCLRAGRVTPDLADDPATALSTSAFGQAVTERLDMPD
jgi:isocitrate dehydrogenase